MCLFACEATFRTGAALPQFLPSPRHALDELIREKELHMHLRTYHLESPGSNRGVRGGLSKEVLLSFALAENALLEEFIDTLEEVLRIGRGLHGVEEWLDEDEQPVADGVSVSTEEGAYSRQLFTFTASTTKPTLDSESPPWPSSVSGTPLTISPPRSPTPSIRRWM